MSANERQKKFEELAEKRVNEAIRRVRLIGKLANRSNYTYTDEHSRQIVKALEDEVKSLKAKFQDHQDKLPLFKFAMKT